MSILKYKQNFYDNASKVRLLSERDTSLYSIKIWMRIIKECEIRIKNSKKRIINSNKKINYIKEELNIINNILKNKEF